MNADCLAINLIAVVSRASVLIVAALTGTLCIYFGWRLYKDAIVSYTRGEYSGKFGKIKLAAVGPGVFFAIFGMWLLVKLVDRPFQLATTSSPVVSQSYGNKHKAVALEAMPTSGQGVSPHLLLIADTGSAESSSNAKNPCLITRTIQTSTMAFFIGQPYSATPEKTEQALDVAIQILNKEKEMFSPDSPVDGISSADIRAALFTLRVMRENVVKN
jgi:hypothetical protein